MTSPMILLAIGSAWAGGVPEILGDRLADFLGPGDRVRRPSSGVFTTAGMVALVLVVVGVGDRLGDVRAPRRCRRPRPRPVRRVTAARKDLYGDAVNESLLMRPGQWLTRLSVYFDNRGVDGMVNTLAAAMGGTSGRLRRIQTGFVRSYALSMFARRGAAGRRPALR